MGDATRALIERILGVWGVALLHFYEANSLWINSIAVVYGVVLWLSWRNLEGIRHWLAESVAEQIRGHPDINQDSQPEAVLSRAEIHWADSLKQSRFPLIAARWGFIPRQVSPDAVQRLLKPVDVAADALEIVTGHKRERTQRRGWRR